MKNSYKWRASNIKYAYLIDVVRNSNGGTVIIGPFLYNRQTGIKTYEGNVTASTIVDEALISDYVKKISNGNDYVTLFNRMLTLINESGDSDYLNIKFKSPNEYFNIDKEDCAINPPPEPCECYEPIINLTGKIENHDYAGPFVVNNGSFTNTTSKQVIHNFELRIPKGEPGEPGSGGGIGPQGDPGLNGIGDKIDTITASAITVDSASTANVTLDVTKTEIEYGSGLTYNEYDLNFGFEIPKGERGEQGDPGDDGDDGTSAFVRNVTATVSAITHDQNPNVTVTHDTFFNTKHTDGNEYNITDLSFKFEIPKGERGEQGPQGVAAMFSGVTINVHELENPDGDTQPYGTATLDEYPYTELDEYGNPITAYKYTLNLDLYLPEGPKGDPGEQGVPGTNGEVEYIYVNESGVTEDDNDVGSRLYRFNDAYICDENHNEYSPTIGHFITKENTLTGTVDIDLCLDKKAFDVDLDLDLGGVYLCDNRSGETIGEFFITQNETNKNERVINVCINKSALVGGSLYCPGSGITFNEDNEDCVTINSNTEGTTVAEILCSSDAPCEALGIWEDDIIPSGTTIQEILEKILCKEVYPSNATTPSITLSNSSLSNNGITKCLMYEVDVDTISPECVWSVTSGKYNSTYNIPSKTQIKGRNYDSNGQEKPFVNWDFRTVKTPVSITFNVSDSLNNIASTTIGQNFETIIDNLVSVENISNVSLGKTKTDSVKLKKHISKFPIGKTTITHEIKADYSKPIVTTNGWNDKSSTIPNDKGGWSTTSRVDGSDYKYAPRTNLRKYTFTTSKPCDMTGDSMTAAWNSSSTKNSFNYNIYSHYPIYQSVEKIGVYTDDVNSLYNSDYDGNIIIFDNLPTTASSGGKMFMCDIYVNNSSPKVNLYTYDDLGKKYDVATANITKSGISHVYAGVTYNCWRIEQTSSTMSSKIKIELGSKVTDAKIWTNNYKQMSDSIDSVVPITDYYNESGTITKPTYVSIKPASESYNNKHFMFEFPYNNTYTNGGIKKIEVFNSVSQKFTPIQASSYEIKKSNYRTINGVDYLYGKFEKIGNAYDNYNEFIVYFEQPLWKYCNNER